MAKRPKRPSDPIARAKLVCDMAVGELPNDKHLVLDPQPEDEPHGRKGGTARADALTPERRKEIAQQAASARWGTTST